VLSVLSLLSFTGPLFNSCCPIADVVVVAMNKITENIDCRINKLSFVGG